MRYVTGAIWLVLAMTALVGGFVLIDPDVVVHGYTRKDQTITAFLLLLVGALLFLIAFNELEKP